MSPIVARAERLTLPAEMSDMARRNLSDCGVKFSGEFAEHGILEYVELPWGWKILETEHPQWRLLVDSKGIAHAVIDFAIEQHVAILYFVVDTGRHDPYIHIIKPGYR